MTDVIQEYQTTQLTEAAALSWCGCRFTKVLVAEDHRGKLQGIFVFINVPTKLLADYENGQIMAEVTSFHAIIKRLSASAKRAISESRGEY